MLRRSVYSRSEVHNDVFAVADRCLVYSTAHGDTFVNGHRPFQSTWPPHRRIVEQTTTRQLYRFTHVTGCKVTAQNHERHTKKPV